MEKLYTITSTDGETGFSISILETGWIYDVFLILTDTIKTEYKEGEFKKIEVPYSCKEILNGKSYSVFDTYFRFSKPSESVIYFFIYSIDGITYVTEPNRFIVEN